MKEALLKTISVYHRTPTRITRITYDEGYVIQTTRGSIYVLYETMGEDCPCAHGIMLVHNDEYPATHYQLHKEICYNENATPSDTVLKRLEGFKIKEVNYYHLECDFWRLEFKSNDDVFNIIVGKDG